ncbi:hypothetical protein EGW08_012799 [Elysia chlorotica]|uniref:Uncharacterized protein n=1 Tax=Elysia chlorotica TaxID=188477 RepID=A0A433TCU2_ELYCH|nr:hypothetical protein EGW08_012799 [Elysia chlorotica]
MKIYAGDPATALRFEWSSIESTVIRNPPHDDVAQAKSALSDHQNNRAGPVKPSRARADQPPCNRYHHAACHVGNYIYVFGGKDRYSPLKDLWRLDIATCQWESLLPWGVDLPHLQGHTMTAYQSQILIFGGSFSESVTGETPLWILSTELRCMRRYHPDPPSCARPTGRREHSCVVHRNSMYIYGGFLDSSGSTDEFWAFNVEEEVWRLIRQHKPGKRHGHVAVAMDAHMWIHGGMKGLKHLSDLWTFNFSMCSWNSVKSLGVSPALSNHTAHLVRNYLLLFGGTCQSKPMNSVWLFQFDTLSWRQVTVNQSDWYPPISLHCSVALGSAVQETGTSTTDRTRSAPQLRKPDVRKAGQLPARPWTSPSQDSNVASKAWSLTNATKITNVLQLENLHDSQPGLIDKNNNPSKEDLTCEAETSFFFPVGLPQQEDRPLSSELLGSDNKGFCNAMVSSGPYSSCIGKVRPASQELCYDKFPLLKSFQSVSSDVTLGGTNLTLTLSDEQVYQHNASMMDKCVASNCSQQTMEMDMPDQFVPYSLRTRSRQQYSSHAKTPGVQSASLGNRAGLIDRCDFINPLYTGTTSSDSDDSCNVIYNPAAKQGFFYPFKDCKRSASLSDIYGAENVPPKYDDIILEDLEGCDIADLFYNIDIASPSSLSASLNHLDSQNENNSRLSGKLKRAYKLSCSDLRNSSLQLSNERKALKSSSLHNVCTENMAFKSDKVVVQYAKDSEPGRYTKNVTSSHRGKLSAASKYRCKYYSSSKLDSLVCTSSIATQTTESQFDLDMMSNMVDKCSTSVHKDQKQSMFNERTLAADPAIHACPSSKKSSGESNSLSKDCHLCVLVIGGQTDSPSFVSEPLKLWRCLLL